VRDALAARMEQVGLRLHPDKTKIVYCKDGNRPGSYEHVSFTFLGYQFRARSVRSSKSGVMFTAFTPAISPEALKKISGEVRSWRIHTHTRRSLQDLADRINPVVRGSPGNYFRTGNAATKFRQVDGYVVWRLRRLMIKKRGRNLRTGQAQAWTEEWFNGHGLYRLRGTIRYPRAA
jgi:RNA-directed DNA polymerase